MAKHDEYGCGAPMGWPMYFLPPIPHDADRVAYALVTDLNSPFKLKWGTPMKGEKGDKGDRGIQGPQGNIGIQGQRGEKGERGEQGIQGQRGPIGPTGERGERGPQGQVGPINTALLDATKEELAAAITALTARVAELEKLIPQGE